VAIFFKILAQSRTDTFKIFFDLMLAKTLLDDAPFDLILAEALLDDAS